MKNLQRDFQIFINRFSENLLNLTHQTTHTNYIKFVDFIYMWLPHNDRNKYGETKNGNK